MLEQIEERNQENQRLTAQKQEVEESSTELRSQLESVTTTNDELSKQILQKANFTNEVEVKNAQVQAKVKELEAECNLKDKMIGLLNSKQQLIEGIRESEGILRKENNELRKQSRRMRENEESLRAENMILRKQRRNENHFLAQVSSLFDPEQPWVLSRSEISMTDNRASGRRLTGSYRGVKVSLKEFTKSLKDEQNQSEFELEVLFHSLCRHPCIIQFIGATEPTYLEENPVIVTEFFETSLREKRKKASNLEVQNVLRIARDLFSALCYLHEFKPDAIIHRDVSPGKIMIQGGTGSTWRAKLADLGSAVFEVDEKTESPGEAFYSAPEASNIHRQTTKVSILVNIRTFYIFVLKESFYKNQTENKPDNGSSNPVLPPINRFSCSARGCGIVFKTNPWIFNLSLTVHVLFLLFYKFILFATCMFLYTFHYGRYKLTETQSWRLVR